MGRLMEKLGSPEGLLWLSGLGRGLSEVGRGAAGSGFDMSQTNMALAKMAQEKKRQERMRGLMANMPEGTFSPAQMSTINTLMEIDPKYGAEAMYNAQFGKQGKRETIRGADGYHYYVDTMERVLPGVQAPPEKAPSGYRYVDPQDTSKGVELIPGFTPRNGITVGTDENGNPIVQIGGSGELQRSTTTGLQKGYISDVDLLGRMDDIAGMYNPDFLTYQGAGEAFFTNIADKANLSPSEAKKEFLRKRTRFQNSIEQLFNAYRKEITGAAAAVQELESLKKSFINMDMGPTQFEAAFDYYQEELKRAGRLKLRLLREGITGKEFGEAMDSLFLGGADDRPEDRFNDLISEGVSAEEAEARMIKEGY